MDDKPYAKYLGIEEMRSPEEFCLRRCDVEMLCLCMVQKGDLNRKKSDNMMEGFASINKGPLLYALSSQHFDYRLIAIYLRTTNADFDDLQKTTLHVTFNILLRTLNLNFVKIL